MPPRKSRTTSKKGATKDNHAAQLPKEDTEESVEYMLANVDNFIDSVYRDLSISPPRRSSIGNASIRQVGALDDESSGSSSADSPLGASSLSGTTPREESTPVVSPDARRNMDLEIERSRTTSKTGAIMDNYATQLPKDDTEESVEYMLDNVDNFIDSVYRDLSISPPPRSSMGNASIRQVGPLDDESAGSSSANSPAVASSLLGTTLREESTPLVFPVARHILDLEIKIIYQMCDNVDQNLRSIGLFMNNCCANNTSTDVSNTNLTNIPSSSEPIIISAFIEKVNSNNNTQRRGTSPPDSIDVQVVDLSNSQAETPEMSRQPDRLNNYDDGDDDDVILVSANIPPIVDLCTPNGYLNVPQAVPHHRQLNRRRLNQYDNVDGADTCREGPSPPRRSRIEPSCIQSDGSKNSNTVQTSSATNNADKEKFMCPVCMDSCLKNKPTSTICGHVYCNECIARAIALTHKCPMCKKRLTNKQTFRIYL